MADTVKWTDAQKNAIALDCDTLLVSAAAGSGKTSVLSARILRKVMDEEHPLDVSRLLVVTYTKASAADLKKKIAKELRRAAAAHPDSAHLRKQLLLLPSAQISTIHSFCFQLIRRYFHKLQLPGKLRIADEAEALLLYDSVMNEIINAYYDGVYTDIDDFSVFADSIVAEKDASLPKKLIEWYSKFSTYTRGILLLQDYAAQMTAAQNQPFATTPWGKQIAEYLLRYVRDFSAFYQKALEFFETEEAYVNKFTKPFSKDKAFLDDVAELLTNYDFSAASAQTANYLKNLPDLRSGGKISEELQTATLECYKDLRETFKKWLKNEFLPHLTLCNQLLTPIFLAQTAQYCRELYAVLYHFEVRLKQEKYQRGILDYTDLEHDAVRLLYNEDGTYSEIAKELGKEYTEIFIDEYQDVNETQDSIFRAIGAESHTFVVGDIKQSIYRFRGSEPSLFSHYRDQYPIYQEDLPVQKEHTVFLSNNFRCDSTVIDTVNLIFSCLFCHNSGKVAYYEEDALVYSKEQEKDPIPCEIALIEPSDTEKPDDSQEKEKLLLQARYIATEIQKLMAEGIAPSEIAILMRSVSEDVSKTFERVFAECKIPIQFQNKASLLERAEIRLMTSLLRVLDNPASDISLTAVLLSPIFSFTLDELILIRRTVPSGSLYHALQVYTDANAEFEKGRLCLQALEQYRHVALSEPIDQTLWYLYRECGIMQFIYRDVTKAQGDSAKANLMQLYDYAKRFESTSYCGLYRFILYLKDVMEKDQALTEDDVTTQENAVQLMTIHKSKGLEFKVCFVARCEKLMNMTDINDELQFCYPLGIAPPIRDKNGVVVYHTPLCSAVKFYTAEEQLDEEMRILYVALTRAKERLYITAEVPKLEQKMEFWRVRSQSVAFPAFMKSNSYIDWIMLALASAPSSAYQIHTYTAQDILSKRDEKECEVSIEEGAKIEEAITLPSYSQEEVESLRQIYEARFAYQYPYEQRVKLPTKLSVSQLSEQILDNWEEISGPFADQDAELQRQPAFLTTGESAPATAAEKGTATHLFMQFADFSYAEKFGAEAERARLVKQNFMTQEAADLVQISAIDGFLQSEFYQQLWKQATAIHREIRFNIEMPAVSFTQDVEKKAHLESESIYVQGIIDCLLETSDGYYLLDYKTDSFTQEMLQNREEVAKILQKRHQKQLGYYQIATKQLTGKPLRKAYLYSFALQDLIEMPLTD